MSMCSFNVLDICISLNVISGCEWSNCGNFFLNVKYRDACFQNPWLCMADIFHLLHSGTLNIPPFMLFQFVSVLLQENIQPFS